jgi:uncharacterized membrane protein
VIPVVVVGRLVGKYVGEAVGELVGVLVRTVAGTIVGENERSDFSSETRSGDLFGTQWLQK